MKKTLTLLFASVALLFTACTKDGESPEVSDNSWFLNGTEYFATQTVSTEATNSASANIAFKDGNPGRDASLTVYFKTLPKGNGTYTLVKSPTATLADNQCAFSVSQTGSQFLLTTTGSITVQVNITNEGKIRVIIPEVSVSTAGGSENYKFKASVYEHK